MKKYLKLPIILTIAICAVFAGLLYLFIGGLHKNPHQLQSQMQGRIISDAESNSIDNVVSFNLPRLDNGEFMTASDMPQPPFLINIWGSWCPECHVEHSYLLKLGKQISIIGIDWPAEDKNEPENAKLFLSKYGNPFQQVLVDHSGQTIIDLGVYGAPETFLIGKGNVILHRFAGPLDDTVWQKQFAPLIAQEK